MISDIFRKYGLKKASSQLSILVFYDYYLFVATSVNISIMIIFFIKFARHILV